MQRRHDEEDEIQEAKISKVPIEGRHHQHRSSSAQRHRRNELPADADSFTRRLGRLRISSIREHSLERANSSSNTPRNIDTPRSTSANETSRPPRSKEVDRADKNLCGWSCRNDGPSGTSRNDNQKTSRSTSGQPLTRFQNPQECGGWGSLARKIFRCDNNQTTFYPELMNELVNLREQHDHEMMQVRSDIQRVFQEIQNLVRCRDDVSASSSSCQSSSESVHSRVQRAPVPGLGKRHSAMNHASYMRDNDHEHHNRRAQSAPRTRVNWDRYSTEEYSIPSHVPHAAIAFYPTVALLREVVHLERSCLETFVTALIRHEEDRLQMDNESDLIGNSLNALVYRLYPGIRFFKFRHFKYGVQAWLSNLAMKGYHRATMTGDSREDIRLRRDAAWQEFRNLSAVSPTYATNEEHPYYIKDFLSFCQRMMDSIVKNTRSKVWPDDLDDYFLEAMKHVWRMRKLALAFEPTASTITAKLTAPFDANFMDALEAPDLFQGGNLSPFAPQVALLVNPGFIVQERVVKCQVYLTLDESSDL